MSMKLVILGLLMEKDSHPYEIRQTMIERAMHHYIKMRDGSLYYAIEQLKKNQHIDTVEIVKDSSRPDRTIYTITSAGKLLFQELLLQQFEEKAPVYYPIATALMFASHGDHEKIHQIILKKIEEQQQKNRKMKEIYDEHVPTVPRSVLHMMHCAYEHGITQLRWLEHLAQDAKDGRLSEIGLPLEESSCEDRESV
ncbi:PadR family transcriptional regulator [Paenibacillus agricola]|uniref:PadR family transcriptional regulator n=1 Tax=Paenibacillus agricola TaxID=2716264 RepID=A0ABX0J861_9BACL|nr:PadR family transcriptional regulator [Paenibacillus agricola]NHN30294.1 PadR family transcriptional regulator [Paenibacillus agricola]